MSESKIRGLRNILTEYDRAQKSDLFDVHSPYSTVLLIALLSFFGAEILTGSTSVEGIIQYPVSFVASLAFYGLQVTVIADLTIKFRLHVRTLYIIGLIYGILEEGIAIFTMESTSTHTLWLSIYGLNLTWVFYVMVLHSVVTVLTTLLIIRVISPVRLETPILSRGGYILIMPVTAVIYYFLMKSSIFAGRVPGLIPVLMLVLLLLILILAAILSAKGTASHFENESQTSKISSLIVIPFAAAMIIPFIIGNSTPVLLALETLMIFLLLIALYGYFRKFGTITSLDRRSLWTYTSSILIVMLVGGYFNRTISSDLLAVFVSAFLIFIGYLRSRSEAAQSSL